MLRRMLYTPVFHIDTNMINARGELEEMNQIEKWVENEIILVNMSEVSFSEAQQGNNEARIRKALGQIYTIINNGIDKSDSLYQMVAGILFPSGITNQNQHNDVVIVCHAHHYQAILITNDGGSKNQPGGMLGNAKNLKNIAEIISPAEALQFIKSKINKRDKHNQIISERTGELVPEWAGCD